MKHSSDYILHKYGKKPSFASFLPGIAGVTGIPIWCFYVNRGQGVVSFGVDNKDHAIMEFLPAHRAYTRVRQTGFRTFLRKEGLCFEPFTNEAWGDMSIGMNTLRLCEKDPEHKILTQVTYFVLPEEPVGALVRRVQITNTDEKAVEIELLDGMPELVPYGVTDWTLKNMLQTGKAWMQAEPLNSHSAYFRVRASMGDTASVEMVEGGNFAVGYSTSGEKLSLITDPEVIFAYDLSLERPVVFAENGLSSVLAAGEHRSNLFPCAFFAHQKELQPGETLEIEELIGQVETPGILRSFLEGTKDKEWFDIKQERAEALTEELTDCIETHTGDPVFDAYCRYTYMDNVLRGGQPVPIGDKVFYTYSRKHGDLERDYNYYSMLPEFYSQGNGNFRDVNQNRRSDTFFSPFVGKQNIKIFYDLLQIDGYNPLSVEMQTYTVPEETAEALSNGHADLKALLREPFTPGRLYAVLKAEGQTDRLEEIMTQASAKLTANFGEGYWSDHWTYNLDLVEEFLAIHPDKERELFFTPEYTWYLSQVPVAPRAKRYVETDGGIRQYTALQEDKARTNGETLLRDASGQIVYSTLFEKLVQLCTVKFAALDPYAEGVEMEGGKPGWYDALNGLPGLIGSSMAEAYELLRQLRFTVLALERNRGEVALLKETYELLQALFDATKAHQESLQQAGPQMFFWNAINDAKEAFWDKTYDGVEGERVSVSTEELAETLRLLADTVALGLRKAREAGSGHAEAVAPTYFYYEVTEYRKEDKSIIPQGFVQKKIPAFLEGPMHLMKLLETDEAKKSLYDSVRQSDLYDRKLSMYRVNASLDSASYEIGRCRAFTPGWLENASIWLHMEYKYMLETLKSGLYAEFFDDFHHAAVPFLDPETYGRSPLENSSFLASSLNPNESFHGRGFVARLSGSTAEFLSIWRRMMFGDKPFIIEDGELVCRLTPAIPSYLIGEDLRIEAVFLGKTLIQYILPDQEDLIPGEYIIQNIKIQTDNGTVHEVADLRGEDAQALRDGRVEKLTVTVART